VDRRNQILLTSHSADEITSELLLCNARPIKPRKTEKKREKKKTSSHLHRNLSNKRGRTHPHKAQNTKHQYQDSTPNEKLQNIYQAD
jgi:hypothetical protein